MLHWQIRQHPTKYQTRRFIDTVLLYPRQDVQALPPKVLKVAKSLPVQVSEGTVKPTFLFTRIEESSLVPAGFLTPQFLQKM